MNDYEAAPKAAGVDQVLHRYDSAGHGFRTCTDAARCHRQAGGDAWARVLRFYGDKLGRPMAAAGA